MEQACYKCFEVIGNVMSNTIQERLEWCRDNNVEVVTKPIFGIVFNAQGKVQYLTERDITAGKIEELLKGISSTNLDIIKSKSRTNVGTIFCFADNNDALRYKLTWGGK